MNNLSSRVPEFFNNDAEGGNLLWQYVQSMSPETVAQLSKPASSEVFKIMEQNIVQMLGNIPSQHFDVTVTTSRENLGRMLFSAMMNGYFLRNVEQRMALEKLLSLADSS